MSFYNYYDRGSQNYDEPNYSFSPPPPPPIGIKLGILAELDAAVESTGEGDPYYVELSPLYESVAERQGGGSSDESLTALAGDESSSYTGHSVKNATTVMGDNVWSNKGGSAQETWRNLYSSANSNDYGQGSSSLNLFTSATPPKMGHTSDSSIGNSYFKFPTYDPSSGNYARNYFWFVFSGSAYPGNGIQHISTAWDSTTLADLEHGGGQGNENSFIVSSSTDAASYHDNHGWVAKHGSGSFINSSLSTGHGSITGPAYNGDYAPRWCTLLKNPKTDAAFTRDEILNIQMGWIPSIAHTLWGSTTWWMDGEVSASTDMTAADFGSGSAFVASGSYDADGNHQIGNTGRTRLSSIPEDAVIQSITYVDFSRYGTGGYRQKMKYTIWGGAYALCLFTSATGGS